MNVLSAPPMPPVGAFVSRPSENHLTRLTHRRTSSSVAVICARGYIDASNADTLTEYARRYLKGCRGLILDLRSLNFFGIEGFSALHRVSVCCARTGIAWAVVPSEAVSRVLLIGDPQGFLPAARNVEAAEATIYDQPHRRAQPGSDITAAAS